MHFYSPVVANQLFSICSLKVDQDGRDIYIVIGTETHIAVVIGYCDI